MTPIHLDNKFRWQKIYDPVLGVLVEVGFGVLLVAVTLAIAWLLRWVYL